MGIDEIFRALGDPTRREVLRLLGGRYMIRFPLRRAAALATCLLVGASLPGHGLAAATAHQPAGSTSRQVTLMSGPDRIYGTLELPTHTAGRRVPGVLLIAGSGSVDRNGNEPALNLDHMNTLRSFAGVLARAGVASLRYDKLGTGRTGHATRQDPSEIGFDLYLGEARAAYHFLATRPEIDPHRLIILGHSEGGLVALILASESLRDPAPRVLVLAAPPGLPILETIREQVARALIQQVQNQQITQAQADAALADLDRIIAQLKATGTIPSDIRTPGLATIFNPTNARYLTQEERYDPRTLATQVPRGLPVLVLHGKKDSQVTEADDKGLLSAFRSSGHDSAVLYDLANVDHVFKEVPGPPNPNPLVDYNNPALPFSRAAGRRLAAFLAAHL